MRVLVAEFNELSPVLMEKFIEAGKLPNFKRWRDESHAFTTEAEDAPDLEPWIQWITVHAGVPFAKHGISSLGDGHKLSRKNVWDLLSDAGRRVWVCGSMNATYREPINGWVLPDPWMTHVRPEPEELEAYYRFVSANVQGYTEEDMRLSRGDQVRFLWFMARHGLKPATVRRVVSQLAAERRADVGWRRATILDRLQFDLFRWQLRRDRPDFSTVFLNSTAHYQHLYWRNMEPEHFKVKPEPGEQDVFEDAILYGYQRMDELCAELFSLVDDDTTLILCTALSQQPCLKYEDIGGKLLYRPKDFEALMDFAGVRGETAPVMAEEFQVRLPDEEEAAETARKLEALTCDGKQVLTADRSGSDLLSGCRIISPLDPDVQLVNADGRTAPFFEIFYQLDLVKSGMHHPDGLLWIRTPDRPSRTYPEKIPLVRIAPTILDLLDVAPPDYMASTLRLSGAEATEGRPPVGQGLVE